MDLDYEVARAGAMLGAGVTLRRRHNAQMPRSDFQSFDGVRLSYRSEGAGRPVVMLHGFLANSRFNWIEPGITAALTDAGFQTLMLDFRGHGRSAAPQDEAAYPADVLVKDGLAFIAHLGLVDYDLVGYSLGARTAVRMLIQGARPRRCVLGGMGDSGVLGSTARVAFFEDALTHGEHGAYPQAAKVINAMIERAQLSRQAMLHVLRSQAQTPREDLASLATPMLCVSGLDDNDNGSAEGLAALLPNADAQRIAGNHLSAVNAELGTAIVGFLR
jgi:pimeloyl-ACP methyl ester carboxylesterase